MNLLTRRRGRKLVSESRELTCGHCGKVCLSREDYAAIQQMGGPGLNQDHPALMKILRRLGGDDFIECPHCHAMHSLVIHVDLDGGPGLWSLVGIKKISDPPGGVYWEGADTSGHHTNPEDSHN